MSNVAANGQAASRGAGGGGGAAPRGGSWDGGRRVRRVLAVVVFAVLAAGAVWLWRLQVAKDRQDGLLERAGVADALAERAGAAIAAEVHRATNFAARCQRGEIREARVFDAAIAGDAQTSPACLAVAWVSRDGVCGRVWSRGDDPVLKSGATPAKDSPMWANALWRAEHDRAARVVDVERRGIHAHVLLVAPAVSGEGTAAAYLGSIAARVDLTAALAPLLPPDGEGDYDVDVYDGAQRLIERGRAIEAGDPLVDGEAVPVLNRFLRVRVRPTGAVLARQSGRSAAGVLYAGLACALGMAWLVSYALRRRWAAVAEAERQVAALQSLAQSAGAISSAPGAGRESLQRLAESAMELLGMKVAAVCVADARFENLEVVASVGPAPPDRRTTYPLSEALGTSRCMETKEVIVFEDADRDGRVNRSVMAATGVRSGMFIPLVVEGRAVGTLFLGHERARAIGEADRQLAGVLASQAGVILANSRLYEQKDAALAAQKELTVRHEALYQIATEIYGSEDLDASLQRLADAAPAVLGVDLCLVSLRTGATRSRIAAVTGNYANCTGEEADAANTNAARVWETRRRLVVEDGPHDPSLNPAYRHRLHVGSIVYLPLLGGDGEAIGTMTLIRHATGPFAAEQLELAEVLAARAAAGIQTAKLHEAARRSAETQRMLLRELNHRVKNNLSSIVGLLSMDRPGMPAEARGWLDRATGRIATLARTHELFVAGKDRIDLRDLVARLLPALATIKPGGAEVRTDLRGVEVDLGTERAVSLAMVLNELCWNALEHGTGRGGVLQIRGVNLGDGRLAIEVEDQGRPADGNGAGAGNGDVPHDGRGAGLRLVEGLVSRELRGRFVMGRTAAGGTLARIEIPLEDGGAEGLSLASPPPK